jgi:kelch-like protein 19
MLNKPQPCCNNKRSWINSCYFTGVAALNQYIYVVGGYDGQRQLNTVERYDTERDSWDFVSSIRIARSALSLTVLDGKLYAMGKESSLSK